MTLPRRSYNDTLGNERECIICGGSIPKKKGRPSLTCDNKECAKEHRRNTERDAEQYERNRQNLSNWTDPLTIENAGSIVPDVPEDLGHQPLAFEMSTGIAAALTALGIADVRGISVGWTKKGIPVIGNLEPVRHSSQIESTNPPFGPLPDLDLRDGDLWKRKSTANPDLPLWRVSFEPDRNYNFVMHSTHGKIKHHV